VHRGADADRHGVRLGAPAVGAGAAGLTRNPLGVAGARGHLAVEAHRCLEDHQRATGAGVLSKRLVQEACRVRDLAVHEPDLHALVPQDPGAPPGRLGRRIVGCDDDARDAGLEDRLGARRGSAVVGAGLERDVEGGAGRVLAAGRESHALRVSLSGGLGYALADHPAVLHEHGPDHRVRTGPAASFGGQLDGPKEVSRVAIFERDLGHRERLAEPN
jgi:hypothetical protein